MELSPAIIASANASATFSSASCDASGKNEAAILPANSPILPANVLLLNPAFAKLSSLFMESFDVNPVVMPLETPNLTVSSGVNPRSMASFITLAALSEPCITADKSEPKPVTCPNIMANAISPSDVPKPYIVCPNSPKSFDASLRIFKDVL